MNDAHSPPRSPHISVRQDWLDQDVEHIIDPQLPIVDAHHHLWDRPSSRYLFDEYRSDTESGHNIIGSVYVQCKSMFNASLHPDFGPVGEVEFANGVAALASSRVYGKSEICAGIVSGANLLLGKNVAPVLEEMQRRAGQRFRGVRNTTAWHSNPVIVSNPVPPPSGVLSSAEFRTGVRVLKEFGLTLDVWAYHTQLDEVFDLALANPDIQIILDHAGGPLGIEQYANSRREVFVDWQKGMAAIAGLENVKIKLGGLAMYVGGANYHLLSTPPSSEKLERDWGQYILAAIKLFTPERCMFESNFPVDKGMVSYSTLWNGFKRIVAGYSSADTARLFSGTAIETYNLHLSNKTF